MLVDHLVTVQLDGPLSQTRAFTLVQPARLSPTSISTDEIVAAVVPLQQRLSINNGTITLALGGIGTTGRENHGGQPVRHCCLSLVAGV